jgi:hypothetical protein
VATSADGPINLGTDVSRVCNPLPEFRNAAFGVILPDDLPKGIRIDSVTLLNAKDIELRGLYLMPMSDERLMLDRFPPVAQFPEAWPLAIEAMGTTVDTSRPQDLVLNVVASPSGGRFDGFTVFYTFSGSRYRADSLFGLTLSAEPCG